MHLFPSWYVHNSVHIYGLLAKYGVNSASFQRYSSISTIYQYIKCFHLSYIIFLKKLISLDQLMLLASIISNNRLSLNIKDGQQK